MHLFSGSTCIAACRAPTTILFSIPSYGHGDPYSFLFSPLSNPNHPRIFDHARITPVSRHCFLRFPPTRISSQSCKRNPPRPFLPSLCFFFVFPFLHFFLLLLLIHVKEFSQLSVDIIITAA